MEYIVTPEEMKRADEITIQEYGIKSSVLMERAALQTMEVLKQEAFDLSKVLVVCGIGNNGGDGLALSRLLIEEGKTPEIVLIGNEEKATKEVREQLEILKALEIEISKELKDYTYTTIVDCLFGISLNRDLEGTYLEIVQRVNRMDVRLLSVDMPSGIHALTGKIMQDAIKADVTVTMQYKKVGQVLYPGADYCGKLVVRNIGILPKGFNHQEPKIKAFLKEEIALPKRNRNSHKGTFGKVLIIAGSEGMCGAAMLSTLSAFRTGCGMVRIMTVYENQESLQTMIPEAMLSLYDKNSFDENLCREAMEWCDCIAIGSGLSTSVVAEKIVRYVFQNATGPIVADADALNIISKEMNLLSECEEEVILTPHIGEMARLAGVSAADIKNHIIESTSDFARSYGVTCVCKDARTVIADENGNIVINLNGNSGMATAGSGDVLTGIISALVAGGLRNLEAASLACAIHAKAGDDGIKVLSEPELMARDLIKYIND